MKHVTIFEPKYANRMKLKNNFYIMLNRKPYEWFNELSENELDEFVYALEQNGFSSEYYRPQKITWKNVLMDNSHMWHIIRNEVSDCYVYRNGERFICDTRIRGNQMKRSFDTWFETKRYLKIHIFMHGKGPIKKLFSIR